jgi:hypothetical protein
MATTHDEVKEAADIVNAILARNQAWQTVPPLDSRMHSRWVLPELCAVLGLDHLHVKRIELVVVVGRNGFKDGQTNDTWAAKLAKALAEGIAEK